VTGSFQEDSLTDIQRLREALQAVLLFYTVGDWSATKQEMWLAITGSSEATTRVLCDHIRRVLAITDRIVPADAGQELPLWLLAVTAAAGAVIGVGVTLMVLL